jgi:hypothetical protein
MDDCEEEQKKLFHPKWFIVYTFNLPEVIFIEFSRQTIRFII